jgi:hypothetical protein
MTETTTTGEPAMTREHEQELALMYLQLLLRTPEAHRVPQEELRQLLEAINAHGEPGLSPEPRTH